MKERLAWVCVIGGLVCLGTSVYIQFVMVRRIKASQKKHAL